LAWIAHDVRDHEVAPVLDEAPDADAQLPRARFPLRIAAREVDEQVGLALEVRLGIDKRCEVHAVVGDHVPARITFEIEHALLEQAPPAGSARPLREYVLAGTADLAAVESELRQLEGSMAAGAHDPATLGRYARAQARLEHAGGYDWRDRATSFVRGLGFTDA